MKLIRSIVGLKNELVASIRGGTGTAFVAQSQRYWNATEESQFSTNSHWRGHGPFADDGLWCRLGEHHVDLVAQAKRHLGIAASAGVMVEWGCGGGMNAHAFAPHTSSYYGVDISVASLEECGRQVGSVGAGQFHPILVPADQPELALAQIQEASDVFLSTYVFELLPSADYGMRVMEIASRLLAVGGIALVQIRYSPSSGSRLARQGSYSDNVAQTTVYGIDEFWRQCAELGLEPIYVTLVPEQPELSEKNYAYFVLQKSA